MKSIILLLFLAITALVGGFVVSHSSVPRSVLVPVITSDEDLKNLPSTYPGIPGISHTGRTKIDERGRLLREGRFADGHTEWAIDLTPDP